MHVPEVCRASCDPAGRSGGGRIRHEHPVTIYAISSLFSHAATTFDECLGPVIPYTLYP